MAFSKARRLSDFIAADGTIPAGKFASGTITSDHIADTGITHADLHTNMDLTGKTVLVANASTGDSDTTAANTAFVQQEIAALVDSAPGTLNTLNELAAALGDDASFSTTVTNSIATKLPLAGGTMTGALTINSGTANTSLTTSSSDAANWMTMTDPSGSIFFGNSGANYQLWVGAAKQFEVTSSASNFTGNVTAPYLATTSYIDLNNSGNRGKIGWSGNHTYIATTSSVGSIIFKNNVSSTDAPQTGGDTLLTLADNGYATFAGNIEVGTFNQNQTNSGEAWIGRAADRQDGSLTIQLGGDSASGTNFEIVDRSWSKVPFFVSGEAPGNALGVNASGIIKIRTAGNVADGTYYSTMTINNTGTSTFSGIRFDRSDVGKWRVGLRNDDKFQISNLFTNGSVGSPNDDAFVITNTSRVGINNSDPSCDLEIGDGSSTYVKIRNASSGDVSSGYNIQSGSTTTTSLYGNAAEGWTTLMSGGSLGFRVNQASSGFNPMNIDTSGRVSMPYQPAFCVYNPAGTYPTSGGTKAFGKNDASDGNYSTYMNVGSHFSTTTGRFTAPIAGNYYFSFSAMFDTGSGGNAGFDFKINDVAKNGGEGIDSTSSTYIQVAGSILFALSVNDYVTLTIRGKRIHQRYGSFEGFLVG